MAAFLEDVAVTAKARRGAPREAPVTAVDSAVAKAAAQQPRDMPWGSTHDESPESDAVGGSSNEQVEQVPATIGKTALALVGKLRKACPVVKDDDMGGDDAEKSVDPAEDQRRANAAPVPNTNNPDR